MYSYECVITFSPRSGPDTDRGASAFVKRGQITRMFVMQINCPLLDIIRIQVPFWHVSDFYCHVKKAKTVSRRSLRQLINMGDVFSG